jgi:hypothetical protein
MPEDSPSVSVSYIWKTSVHEPEGPAPMTTASIGFSSVEPAVPEHTCSTVVDFLLASRRFIFAEGKMQVLKKMAQTEQYGPSFSLYRFGFAAIST